ncbi:hypothetical protein AB6A40_005553 [Gnathostoma spinigerum]|uniref:Uncharacterized protein n=1 Tax=Gnathostoma spinigerum TaxID=75299 RepID=A0ABD6ENE7_9BILA
MDYMAMLYGSETRTVMKKTEMMMRVAQRRMDRMMARVTLRDRKTNEWLRGVTKVKDFVKCARKTKIQWARKLALMDVNNWARRSTKWQSRREKEPRSTKNEAASLDMQDSGASVDEESDQ